MFDIYVEYSVKYSARKSRRPGGYKIFQLSMSSPLPSQNKVLTISENKKQLIGILVESLKADENLFKNTLHKIVITGQEEVPKEIYPGGIVIDRINLKTTHEEADPIVVAQAMYVAKVEGKSVSVVADDTDVFALLLHHYFYLNLHVPMIMESPKKREVALKYQLLLTRTKT